MSPRGRIACTRRTRATWTTPRREEHQDPRAAVDGNGQPTALFQSPGQASDGTAAETLLAYIEAGITVIADKVYHTNAILDYLAEAGATAVIPTRRTRTEPRTLDTVVYATRNLVERFFCRTKESRRVATRHDTRARNFMPAVTLAATRYLMGGLHAATICVHGLNRSSVAKAAESQQRDGATLGRIASFGGMIVNATFVGIISNLDPAVSELGGAQRDSIALWSLFTDTIEGLATIRLIDEEATHSEVSGAILGTLEDSVFNEGVETPSS